MNRSLAKSYLPFLRKFIAIGAIFTLLACQGKKQEVQETVDTSPGQVVSGASTDKEVVDAPLTCGPGEFLDATGKSKKTLSLKPSLYLGNVDSLSMASQISSQDTLVKGTDLYYARSIPLGIILLKNGVLVKMKRTIIPSLALEFFEEGGRLLLAAGNYAGVDYYEVGATDLTSLHTDHSLGAVQDISARDGQLCLVANGGQNVVYTNWQAGESEACGQVLYDAQSNSAANNKALNAQHVAAVPEGCVVATRNFPRFQFKLIDLFDFIRDLFDTTTPQKIDLRGMEDKLFFLGKDGSFKDIPVTVGNYDQVMFSDVDAFPDGAVATYIAFKGSNWDAFSAAPFVPFINKLGLFIKTFFEIRAGGIFVVNKEIKKSTELVGLGGFNIPFLGTTITEIPHFSLPYFGEGAVDGNRYALKGMYGFTFFDFSNYSDPNLTSLPMEERTFLTDPNQPSGIFTNFNLAPDKLFMGGLSNGKVQINYDTAAKILLNVPPAYSALPMMLNIVNFSPAEGMFATGALRDGYFMSMIAGPINIIAHRKAGGAPGSGAVYAPGAQLAPLFGPNYKGLGIPFWGNPIGFESPSGAAEDKVAWAYLHAGAKKLLIEVLRPDGSLVAKTAAEVLLDDTPILGAMFSPGAMTEDLLVVGILDHTLNWSLNGFRFNGGNVEVIPLAGKNYFYQGPGSELIYSVQGLKEFSPGKYRVLALVRPMPGPNSKVVRIDFDFDGTLISNPVARQLSIPDLVNLVTDADRAFGVDKKGNVIPINLETMGAEPSLGSLLDDPSQDILFSSCGIRGKEVYCSGFITKKFVQLYRFDLESKAQTTFPYHRPWGFLGIGSSFVSSKLLVTHDIDGGGVQAFDLDKVHPPAPAVPFDDKGVGEVSNDSGVGSVAGVKEPTNPSAFKFGGGGGGCSLQKPSSNFIRMNR